MLQWMKKIGLSLAILAFFLGSAGFAADYNWKFAYGLSNKATIKYHEEFINKVHEYTNGQINIKYFPDGQLGSNPLELFQSVADGSIDLTFAAPYVNLVPGGINMWIPWTVGSWEEYRLAFEPEKGISWKMLHDIYEEVGMVPLFSIAYGSNGIGNKVRPIKSPEDFKNLKFRVSSSLGYIQCLRNMSAGMGTTFETLPYSEIYNALSKGVVDAIWTLWPQFVEDRHLEVIKYVTDLRFAWDVNNVIINKNVWDSLPKNLQEAVMKAANEVQTKASFTQETDEEGFKKKIREAGVEITELTEEERAIFRERANMPAIWNELCKPWLDKKYPGENMTEKLQAEFERIRLEAAKK